MKLTNIQIAARISEHLKRLAADPEISKPEGKTRYWESNSWAAGKWVYVRYVRYQNETNLNREEALKYLEWLDAGNIGKHYIVLSE